MAYNITAYHMDDAIWLASYLQEQGYSPKLSLFWESKSGGGSQLTDNQWEEFNSYQNDGLGVIHYNFELDNLTEQDRIIIALTCQHTNPFKD